MTTWMRSGPNFHQIRLNVADGGVRKKIDCSCGSALGKHEWIDDPWPVFTDHANEMKALGHEVEVRGV